LAALLLVLPLAAADAPLYEAQLIFNPQQKSHGHVHASCIVVCPNGDLRAVWYESGKELPPPFFSKEHDKSDDVRIGGARKPAGAKAWKPPFVMADTFGVSDNNPCMVIDKDQRLWLFYASLLGVPENTWGSDLLQYRIAKNYSNPGAPHWDYSNILVIKNPAFETGFQKQTLERAKEHNYSKAQTNDALERSQKRFNDPFERRLGWMPRVHPFIRSDGALILPVSNENYDIAGMAITKDGGKTWTYSQPVPGRGVEQPSLVEWPDHHITAFFRSEQFHHLILRSESQDGGMTWSPLKETTLPNPDSGVEAVLLKSGRLAMVYNDLKDGPRDSLAVSLSEDEGNTWPYTRHLERKKGGRYDYPSLVQAPDGTLHVTYSYNTQTIKYAHFNEAWVMQGDPK